MTLTFDHKIKRGHLFPRASTVPSCARFKQRGQKILCRHFFLRPAVWPWPCDLKINTGHLLFRSIHCTMSGNFQAQGSKDIVMIRWALWPMDHNAHLICSSTDLSKTIAILATWFRGVYHSFSCYICWFYKKKIIMVIELHWTFLCQYLLLYKTLH